MIFYSKSPSETKKIALKLAKKLKGGEILALVGDLGGGKTTFTKGLVKGLGINKLITSPSFLIMKIHNIKKGRVKKFCHVDAYRLKKNQELTEIGLIDYLNKKEVITVIEWADKIRMFLKKFNKIRISFKFINENQRKITILNDERS